MERYDFSHVGCYSPHSSVELPGTYTERSALSNHVGPASVAGEQDTDSECSDIGHIGVARSPWNLAILMQTFRQS